MESRLLEQVALKLMEAAGEPPEPTVQVLILDADGLRLIDENGEVIWQRPT